MPGSKVLGTTARLSGVSNWITSPVPTPAPAGWLIRTVVAVVETTVVPAGMAAAAERSTITIPGRIVPGTVAKCKVAFAAAVGPIVVSGVPRRISAGRGAVVAASPISIHVSGRMNADTDAPARAT